VERTILFICTGNYYRSRFAEALFNHHAELRGLNWRAISRGLAIERVIQINKLSHFTLAAMLQRGIKRQHTSEDLNALTSLDLIETDLAIAMCETEHRPMMIEKYPLWSITSYIGVCMIYRTPSHLKRSQRSNAKFFFYWRAFRLRIR
jgi:protein-tyrosine phosphatase